MAKALLSILLIASAWVLFTDAAWRHAWSSPKPGYYRHETLSSIFSTYRRCPVGIYLAVPQMLFSEGANTKKNLSEAMKICGAQNLTLPPKSAAHCLWDFAYHSGIGNYIGYDAVWTDGWLTETTNDFKLKSRDGSDANGDDQVGNVICYAEPCKLCSQHSQCVDSQCSCSCGYSGVTCDKKEKEGLDFYSNDRHYDGIPYCPIGGYMVLPRSTCNVRTKLVSLQEARTACHAMGATIAPFRARNCATAFGYQYLPETAGYNLKYLWRKAGYTTYLGKDQQKVGQVACYAQLAAIIDISGIDYHIVVHPKPVATLYEASKTCRFGAHLYSSVHNNTGVSSFLLNVSRIVDIEPTYWFNSTKHSMIDLGPNSSVATKAPHLAACFLPLTHICNFYKATLQTDRNGIVLTASWTEANKMCRDQGSFLLLKDNEMKDDHCVASTLYRFAAYAHYGSYGMWTNTEGFVGQYNNVYNKIHIGHEFNTLHYRPHRSVVCFESVQN
eukprot:scpid56662/ scgid6874/ 